MNRVVIVFNEGYANLEANRLWESGDYIKAYNDDKLVGIFRIDEIKMAYKSEKGGK